jgi:hypothetical protein
MNDERRLQGRRPTKSATESVARPTVAALPAARMIRHALANIVAAEDDLEFGNPSAAYTGLREIEAELACWLAWNEVA